jgi:hypothetical protein
VPEGDVQIRLEKWEDGKHVHATNNDGFPGSHPACHFIPLILINLVNRGLIAQRNKMAVLDRRECYVLL